MKNFIRLAKFLFKLTGKIEFRIDHEAFALRNRFLFFTQFDRYRKETRRLLRGFNTLTIYRKKQYNCAVFEYQKFEGCFQEGGTKNIRFGEFEPRGASYIYTCQHKGKTMTLRIPILLLSKLYKGTYPEKIFCKLSNKVYGQDKNDKRYFA